MRPRDLIKVKKITIKDVPCLLIRPTAVEGKLPTLFHYHGWSSKKESHKFLATTVAQYGYQVILPDSNFHGDRGPLIKYNLENLKEYFGKIISQSIKEFEGIRKEAQTYYNVDENRIALSGSSMGGFITSSIFARNQDIKSLVIFNGACAWKKAEELLIENGGSEVVKHINTEELTKFDPITYKDSFYPRPILMLHGDADTSVPIDIQRYFYKEVSPLYKEAPERIKLEEYHNMNHHISIRMVESAVLWLEKYL